MANRAEQLASLATHALALTLVLGLGLACTPEPAAEGPGVVERIVARVDGQAATEAEPAPAPKPGGGETKPADESAGKEG